MSNKAGIIPSIIQIFYPKTQKKWLRQRCVKDVVKYLGESEQTEAVLFGKALGLLGHSDWGGLWATDRRLLWVVTGFLGSQATDYTYDKINQISITPSWPGTFTITLSNSQTLVLQWVDKEAANKFADFVRSKIANPPVAANAEPSKHPPTSIVDLATQLERLSQLRSQGLISEEEFRAAKAKLLDL